MVILKIRYILRLACFLTIVLVFYWQAQVELKTNKKNHSKTSTKVSNGTFKQQSHQPISQDRNLRDMKTLESIVQSRLFHSQNPKNCTAAKKVLCETTNAGFGANLHHLTFCLIFAYASQRTLILQSKNWKYAKDGWETMFLPVSTNCTSTMKSTVTKTSNLNNATHYQVLELELMGYSSFRTNDVFSIPKDIDSDLRHVHRKPLIWWIGQFVLYLTRPNKDLQNYLQDRQKILGNMRPIAGLQIRRTDKLKIEAEYHGVEEYMKHVEEWFNLHEKNVTSPRYVYIATDEPAVLKEARDKYPNYTFISEETSSTLANGKRYTIGSARGIMLDIQMLSKCNFVTCTLSSNICRVAFELMQARDGQASERLKSLDYDYFFAPGWKFWELNSKKSNVGVQIKELFWGHDRL